MKKLLMTISLALLPLASSAATNNYAEMERKEAARKQQAKIDHEKREQYRARLNKEKQQQYKDFGKSQEHLRKEGRSGNSSPGRMMDIK